MLATGNDSNAMYAGMKFENGYITIGGEWENVKAPSSIGGADTQNIHVHLEGVDEHCERARAAGAMIVQEPEDQFHGELHADGDFVARAAEVGQAHGDGRSRRHAARHPDVHLTFRPGYPGTLPKNVISASRPPMATCGGITLPSARPVR